MMLKKAVAVKGCNGLFYVIGNFVSYNINRHPPGDAHSRERYIVAFATALGARVSQAKLYFY